MPSRIEHPVRRRGLYALLIAGAVAGVVALGLTIGNQLAASNQTADHALLRAQRAQISALAGKQAAIEAAQAKFIAQAVARERTQAILTECEDQNARHTATLRELHRIVAKAERHARTAAQRRQIAASVQGTILLIDTLAPYQKDCKARVLRLSRP